MSPTSVRACLLRVCLLLVFACEDEEVALVSPRYPQRRPRRLRLPFSLVRVLYRCLPLPLGLGFCAGSRFKVPGSGFRVPGSGFRVSGFGFRDIRSADPTLSACHSP
ncbi:hypothetical protein T484DRAFT_2513017 [Baffinella frigidus]|nr:hypothetical protein T484DRAFT_2513017 [Cryptophyta sp. CCMP2293]